MCGVCVLCRCAKSEEVEGEWRKVEEMRRDLERRLLEVEGEKERMRLEVTAHFEEEARQTQRQHHTKAGTSLFLINIVRTYIHVHTTYMYIHVTLTSPV